MGGPGGGPLSVNLTKSQFDALTLDLYRRCRLPLDQVGLTYIGCVTALQATCHFRRCTGSLAERWPPSSCVMTHVARCPMQLRVIIVVYWQPVAGRTWC